MGRVSHNRRDGPNVCIGGEDYIARPWQELLPSTCMASSIALCVQKANERARLWTPWMCGARGNRKPGPLEIERDVDFFLFFCCGATVAHTEPEVIQIVCLTRKRASPPGRLLSDRPGVCRGKTAGSCSRCSRLFQNSSRLSYSTQHCLVSGGPGVLLGIFQLQTFCLPMFFRLCRESYSVLVF